MKRLTQRRLTLFVEGQLEVNCDLGRHVHRGKIKKITLNRHRKEVVVLLEWNAQLEGGCGFIRLSRLRYVFDLMDCTQKTKGKQIIFHLPSAETVTFFYSNHPTNIDYPNV